MISRVIQRPGDGATMNVWCCAAIAIGGGDEWQQPNVDGRPALKESAPNWRQTKNRPMAPVARQALPPITPPEESIPLTPTTRTGVPTYVDRGAPAQRQIAAGQALSNYSQMQIANEQVSYEYAPPKTTWWRRLLGLKPETPAMRAPAPYMEQAPMMAQAPPQRPMAAPPTQYASQPMPRDPRQMSSVAPQSTSDGWRRSESPIPQTMQPSVVEQPMQTAERPTYTVRKPTSMMRDASDWDTSKVYPYSKPQQALKAKMQTPQVDEWGAPVVAAEPLKPEMPKPEMPKAPANDWTDDVIRRTMQNSEVRQKERSAPATTQVAHSDRITTNTYAGKVVWTQAAGGHWVLKTSRGDYLLKGDPDLLRLKVGDQVEVIGAVKSADAMGMPAVIVERISMSTRR